MDIVNKDTTPIQPLLSVFNGIVPMNSLCSLAPELAVEKINAYYKDIQSGENGRYLSWEHCYSFFAKQRNQPLDEEHIDLLCLHLAFYLASWGMYRGSSFLLQRDYRIHRNIVIEIFTAAYLPLWGVPCEALMEGETLALLFKLARKMEQIYVQKRADIDGRTSVSEALLTKILLGTLGCVPAYDRYFVTAIRKFKIASGEFTPKSICHLAQFYLKNKAAFSSCRMSINGLEYPQMKAIDMCFWQIGYESEELSDLGNHLGNRSITHNSSE